MYDYKTLDRVSTKELGLLRNTKNYIPTSGEAVKYIVVYEQQSPIGIAALWYNKIHPYRSYISVFIHEHYRRQGIGCYLFNTMRDSAKIVRLQTAFDFDNYEAIAFAEALGFKLARKCFCYRVSSDDFNVCNRTQSLQVKSFDEIDEVTKDSVFQMVFEEYKIKHKAINSVNEELSVEGFKQLICDDINEFLSGVLFEEGSIKGYCLIYGSIEEGLYLGYVGGYASHEVLRDFFNQVTSRIFEHIDTLEIEVDDCDKDAILFRSLFENPKDISWDTYVLD